MLLVNFRPVSHKIDQLFEFIFCDEIGAPFLDLDLGEVFKDRSEILVLFVIFANKEEKLFEYCQAVGKAFLIAIDNRELGIVFSPVGFTIREDLMMKRKIEGTKTKS